MLTVSCAGLVVYFAVCKVAVGSHKCAKYQSLVYSESHISIFNSLLTGKHRHCRVTEALRSGKELKWLDYKTLLSII